MNTLLSVAIFALLGLSASSGAAAVMPDASTYGPPEPGSSSLVGSVVTGVCEGNAPWIEFDVVVTGGDAADRSAPASLVLTNGSETTTVQLGTLSEGELQGRVLWPGAAVGSDGRGSDWPGWTLADGTWSESDDDYAWTRGDVSATLVVNPTLAVPVAYPQSTTDCATAPAVAGAPAGSLPATGGDSAMMGSAVVAGSVAVAAGAALLLLRRPRRARS